MDLLTADIKKTYLRYFWAAIGASLVTSIYSLVDTIAIGQYEGPNGTAALATTQTIWTVMICLGILIGVGGSIMMSTCRGGGRTEEGNQYFTLSLLCSVLCSAVITVLFQIFQEQILIFSGSDQQILPYALRYSKWLILAMPLFMISITLGDFIRNDNAPEVPSRAVIIGGIANMIGDYLFVFVFDMGIAGAGLATALGQLLCFCTNLSYLFTKRCSLRLVWPKKWLSKLGRILTGGMAPFLIDLSFGVMVLLFNNQIRRYAGNTELAVFGAVSNLAILFQALFYGVGRALQPLASTNMGAGQYDRARTTLRYGLISALLMGGLFAGGSLLFPEPILQAYMKVTPEVLAAGPGILRVYATSFFLMGVNVVVSYYLQAVLQKFGSLLVSLLRGIIFCAAYIYLLPLLFGFDAIWWSMPLTELSTCLAAVLILLHTEKKEGRG